ncbi:MAG TPA: CDC27 family protein [Polyangiaceae bacterium]|nr:CDC27 family protein [Polyangiaceae bacterium]
MSRSRSRMGAWMLVALIFAVAAPASAQKSGGARGSAEAGAPSAKQLYASAQKLFDKGRYAEALVAFRQAHNASSSPNARLMIGHCLVALGKNAEAYEEMAATMREAAQLAEGDRKYAPTRDAAAMQVAQLEPKVGKVIVEIQDRAGVTVTLNGERLVPEKLGLPIAVDPGTASVGAVHIDGRTVSRELSVKAGATERVTLTFSEARSAGGDGARATPAPLPQPPEDQGGEDKTSGGGVRTAGFVVASLGVAGMAVFGVTGMMARSRFATLETECGGRRCADPKYADVVDTGMFLTTTANIGLIAGAAGLVGGGLMILLGGPSDTPPASGSAPAGGRGVIRGAALTVSPGGASVQVTATF